MKDRFLELIETAEMPAEVAQLIATVAPKLAALTWEARAKFFALLTKAYLATAKDAGIDDAGIDDMALAAVGGLQMLTKDRRWSFGYDEE